MLSKRKIIPVLKKNFKDVEFSICSVSQKKEDIGAQEWFRDYGTALKKSKADIVYISLVNSLHYYWAKKFLNKNYHVIIDKPATINFQQAKSLVQLAKKKRKLLSEAVFFNYHHQIKKSIKEINSIQKIIHVDTKFVIPKLEKKNYRNFKKYGGGCFLDMSPYAAAAFRIFIGKKIKEINYFSYFKKNNKGLNESFNVYVQSKAKSFSGYFSHNGEYENSINLLTKKKEVRISRVFSPPQDKKLILQVIKNNTNNKKIMEKDNSFYNYLKHIFLLIKKKRFKISYQNLLEDSLFKQKILK